VTLPSFRIPFRFLRARDGRTSLTIVAIALGIALVCALDLVTRSMQLAFEEIIDTMAGRTALEVGAGDGGLVAEDLANRVARVPGVEVAVPVVRATAFSTDGSGESLTVHGIDILNDDALRLYEARDPQGAVVDDPVRFFSDPHAVVLTRSFAARHGLHEGDTIELDTPRGRRRFPILSLLEPTGIARVYGGNLVVMDVAAAEDVFTQRGLVNRIDVAISRDTSVDVVRSAVERILPPGLRVTTPAQRKVDLHDVMQSFDMLLRAIGLVGLVVAYLIAFNAVSSGFERRGWQLGVLAAIGARPSAIWREQMKEAFLLSVASAVLGVLLGMALAHILLPVIATSTALNFNLIAPQARLVPSPASIALAVALGIAATLLAAWLPAARAVRMGVAETIRGRGKEASRRSHRTTWIVAALLAACTVAAATLESIFRSATFGLAATAFLAATLAAAASPILQIVAHAALPTLVRLAGGTGRFAATGLRDSPRRVGMTTATIAVGVAAVVWLCILARSFQGSVVEALGRAIRADLVVTSTNIGSGFLEAPLDGDIVATLRTMPGVRAVAGWRALEWPYQGESVGLSAYDPQYFRDAAFGEWTLIGGSRGGEWSEVAAGRGVVVSTSFIKSFGRAVGENLIIETPTGPLVMPILGVTVDFVSPKGTVEMSRDVFVERWRDASVTRTFVVKEDGADSDDLRAGIAARLGSTFQIRILSAKDLLEYFATQVRRAFSVIPVFACTVFLVILVGTSSSLATSVLERRRELAIVRAMGVRPGVARRIVVLESLVIGFVGLGLAAIGGCLLAVMWVQRTFPLLLGWTLDVRVPTVQLILLSAATLAVCYVASRVPARRAEILEVAEALRHE
jgi:putative ABC transport system permease protein